MSIFGKVSGHLIEAHETIASHVPRSAWERRSLVTVSASLVSLLYVVRQLHHRSVLGQDGDES